MALANGGAGRPKTLAEVSLRVRAGVASFDPALREFLDEFYGHPNRRQVALAEEPAPLDAVKDAYLAATAEHLSESFGLDAPAWVEGPSRMLHKPFFAGGIDALRSTLIVESPAAFRRRLIFISADALFRPRAKANPKPVV